MPLTSTPTQTQTRPSIVPQGGVLSSDPASTLATPALSPTIAPVPPTADAIVGSSSNGVLSVFGDALNNQIVVSRNAAGQLLLNGGAVAITGGPATVANTTLIQVFGQGGNDIITLDESNGALPRANLFGGAGDDVLTGGSGADQLFGQADNDTLLGKGGNDFLFGGAGDDVLTGGDGDDQLFGEAGNDRMIWNPGDDSDLFEGGAGTDTAEVNGGNGSEVFSATANGTRVRFDRLNPAPFTLDIGTTEHLVVHMNGGDDTFSATGNLAALLSVTVDGGTGNDTISGSNVADVLIGGEGDDFIDGQQGNDTAFLGAGHDVFQWDPGDGSDIVEGGDGNDRMLFNGSAGNEIFDVAANGGRVRQTRNLGNIVMDLDDVERIDLAALGGTDVVTINDMTGTDLRQVNVDLAGNVGGTTGDGQADSVTVHGTGGNDVVDVFGAGSAVSVVGLTAQVTLANAEGANDTLVISGGNGNDGITASTVSAGVIKLVLDGGAGNDTLLGSQGADTLLGGDGNDFILGDNGNDVALMGAGDDTFQWNPGDGNDVVEGQDGKDTMLFFGANVAENINLVANGGRALFLRDVANVTMDLNDVEKVDFRALGGADSVVIGDLSGTDVTQVAIDLRGSNGGADGSADTVTVNGTQGSDTINLTGNASGVKVFGLSSSTAVSFLDAGLDRIVINGQGGDDVVNASGLQANGPLLTINGGLGNDTMIGGAGNDLFVGGDGNDTALMGAGDDTFVWNPGDDNDVIEGQAGRDTMLFNGANVAENIEISANGGRVVFSRNIANVVMDLNDTEVIDFRALAGADQITVNDLSGTDVTEVHIDLAGTGGAGDGAADTIVLQGTSGDDVIQVIRNGNTVQVIGLAATVVIENFEAGVDRLVINALGGDDIVDAGGLSAGSIQLTANGGNGNDVLIGGDGNDVLIGGDGDDVLIGGPGLDVLDGGPGDNVVIQ